MLMLPRLRHLNRGARSALRSTASRSVAPRRGDAEPRSIASWTSARRRAARWLSGLLSLGGFGLTSAWSPSAAQAQEPESPSQLREVVSKEVSVGDAAAALRLELAGGGDLEIRFRDGVVLVDGEPVGSFQAGGELERAWRELLGAAVALEDGPLARSLADWTAPAELEGQVADVARRIDRALEEALAADDAQADAGEPSVSVSMDDEGALLRVLLGSLDRLGVLEDAFEGLGPDFQVHVDENVDVPAGSVVEGTLVVIEGDLSVSGQVDGDVVVIGGTLELLEGSEVSGEVRFADARVLRNQGVVRGGLVDVLEDERAREADLRSQLRNEVRDELRSELRREIRNVTRMEFDDRDGFSIMAPFAAVARGLGGVLENLIAVLVLGLIGAAAVAFAGENVDAIAETARRAPGRAAMVGVAGTFLLIPAWILGAVALIVSIVGIPVAVAWLPLFPMAAAAAAVVGYLAVARNAGEWLADSDYPWTGWIRKSNGVFTIFAGLLGLVLAFVAANVISMAPFLGFLSGLLTFAGVLVTFAAVQIGFGAVLLTRGGRKREYWRTYDPDEAWEAAMRVDVDMEPPATAGGRKGRRGARSARAGGGGTSAGGADAGGTGARPDDEGDHA